MLFIFSTSLCSCSYSIKRYGIENSENENILFASDDSENMSMLLRYYIYDHFKQPETVDDLIRYYKNFDDSDEKFYRRQYRFLVRNKCKLHIINNDSITMIFYNHYPNRDIAGATFTTPCEFDEERSGLRTRKLFFDLEGYCFYSEPLSEKLRLVYPIAQKYVNNIKPEKIYIAILEYTPEKGLIDICAGESFDLIKSSECMSEMEHFLEDFCKENSLSRVIFPINADKSSQ